MSIDPKTIQPESVAAETGLQLLVFERKTPRSHWQYVTSKEAAGQAQLNESEAAIRRLYAHLHPENDVTWSVAAIDDDGGRSLFALSISKGQLLNRRSEGRKFPNLDGLNIVLTLPEKIEMTSRADLAEGGLMTVPAGYFVIHREECSKCKGSGTVPHPLAGRPDANARDLPFPPFRKCRDCAGAGMITSEVPFSQAFDTHFALAFEQMKLGGHIK